MNPQPSSESESSKEGFWSVLPVNAVSSGAGGAVLLLLNQDHELV